MNEWGTGSGCVGERSGVMVRARQVVSVLAGMVIVACAYGQASRAEPAPASPQAQQPVPPASSTPPIPPTPPAAGGPADADAPAFKPEELEQILAPIALYPDTLLSQDLQ